MTYAAVGTIEAYINLYYNQILNIDLSEQMFIDCYWSPNHYITELSGILSICQNSNDSPPIYCWARYAGLADEKCDPADYEWVVRDCSYDNLCQDWKKRIWRIAGSNLLFNLSEEEIKELIITKGPLFIALLPEAFPDEDMDGVEHAVVLVGYENTPNGIFWIFKNSWGENWGNDGYGKTSIFPTDGMVLYPMASPIPPPDKNFEIRCVDRDLDGFCNWGISDKKPVTCPVSCEATKDCDDSNRNLGPFDANFNCIINGGGSGNGGGGNDISVGKISPTTAQLNITKTFSAQVSDNGEVVGCALKINGSPTEYMTLSESPCKNCTASLDYKFTSKGSYSLLARCIDNEGNAKEGEPVIINIGASCPDCGQTHIDLCETPAKCEKDCGADAECDEKERFSSWVTGNYCYSCSGGCGLDADNTKPSSYTPLGNDCRYNCEIKCGSNGWTVVYGSGYCDIDKNKLCNDSICAASGWDNSACGYTPVQYNKELYITEGFNNPDDYIDGNLYCNAGDALIRGNCLPDDRNDIVIFNTHSETGDGWHCRFDCNGWCTADGTIKITCEH